jgi:predicted anti-sigma-YlaC factor YlaD
MKCIDNSLIQRYIDGETDIRETEQIENHIANCSSCADKIEEKKAFAHAIKNELQKLSSPFVAVPEFTIPVTQKRRLNSNFKRIAYIASAACVAALMLFVLLPERHENGTENQFVMYSVIKDFDANRTFSQQDKSIYILDNNGNIIEII